MKENVKNVLLGLAVFATVTPIVKVLADATYDGHAYVCYPSQNSNNDSNSGQTGATAGTSGGLQQKVGNNWNNVTQFVTKEKEKGFSGAQLAVIIAVFARESGWNPSAVNASSGNTGIGQWGGGRLTKLSAMGNATDLNTQISFMEQELAQSYTKVFTGGTQQGGTASGALGPMETVKGWYDVMGDSDDDIKDLFHTWNLVYEGVSNVGDTVQTNETNTLNWAKDAYNDDGLDLKNIKGDASKLKESFPTDGGSLPSSGSTTSTTADDSGCDDDDDSSGNGGKGWILDPDNSYMYNGSMGSFPSYSTNTFSTSMNSTDGDHNGYDVGVANSGNTKLYASYFHDWALEGQPDTVGKATTLYAPFDVKIVSVTTNMSANAGGLGVTMEVTNKDGLPDFWRKAQHAYIYVGHMPNGDNSKIKVGDTFKAGQKLNDVHVAGPSNGFPHVHLETATTTLVGPNAPDQYNPASMFEYLQKVYGDGAGKLTGGFSAKSTLPATGASSSKSEIPKDNYTPSGAIKTYNQIMKGSKDK